MVKELEKILLVEDNKPIAKALSIKLKENGYDVVIANDGKEALEKLRDDKFGLLLLDLIMPEMDGFAFLEEFNKKNIKAGVIVVSNIGTMESKERLKGMGVYDYLVKSDYKLEEIVKKIDAYFKKE
ncbi:MAG: hypothetical protein A2725_00695 [Candidatus Magasanikbacteria bacterium RIFCSPHIGHO2_01_FULL_33_34]|uniref:Response regulatory domain-containing protein n=1 Tax=Candidatus Magasanikbacteria bacterium RIFCSPHIGHO2_01_FULL_33_34 TaxID=1798671 RepID=A0A1F6LJ45_9BACT|nr:MAG: hypothetical protein A2725_00695 [Candidatus Magasanikbacteria bacterium RIFCSPHIGHO2_01_FULL_33_34]OGH65279.1 MAG: hypothetical protein A3B83_04355 [Candidatus Magasanikbacteria bacterium RIFCSPHIGHO2_02_FULL_33_17]OGH76056.1 MAG: hypothetical protein A3A89_01280 [Candidatus Magasanikbacteria bacterium RIFCSPLOWO2_01_FULL_33_34]OGH81773.1 MAG: hypothetical protein A3F93_00880 [Candidatus Magasanikbacteria bacterium RIFCSPLOWO2_12_FULL_34_7]